VFCCSRVRVVCSVGSVGLKRVAILGNAGSGKSTLARSLARARVAVLDLDRIVWEPNLGPLFRPQEAVVGDLKRFCISHAEWIVEGCYGDLVETVLPWTPELIFLNPGEEVCLRNCRNRPWEPHKYSSKAEQDASLQTLLSWVSAYYTCGGPMSLAGHRTIFDAYDGPKREVGKIRNP
jgi:adenylate kinase family enzyme